MVVTVTFERKCFHISETNDDVSGEQILTALQSVMGVRPEMVLLSCNGRLVHPSDTIADGSIARVQLRILGGKGGFGSMLRAIGAQIEKTTNREACRDLSGRRLRDINEEKRLKRWLSKKADREREAEERKQERLERLRRQPKHDFHDPHYDKERSDLVERVSGAVEEGMKRKLPTQEGPSTKKPKALWLGSDDLDVTDSSDEEGACPVDRSRQSQQSSAGTSSRSSPEEPEDNAAIHESLPDTPSRSSSEEPEENVAPDDSITGTSSKSSHEEPEDNATPDKRLPGTSSKSSSEQCKSVVPEDDPSTESIPPRTSSESERKRSEQTEEGDGKRLTKESTVEGSNEKASSTELPQRKQDFKTDEVERKTEGQQLSNEKKEQETQKLEQDDDLDLNLVKNIEELEALGMDRLKLQLSILGLKCGGALKERAQRLWSVKGLKPEQIDPKLKAKPSKK